MKFMDKLGNSYVFTTMVLFSGMVWGGWYAIVSCSSPTFFKWCLGLIPPIVLIVALAWYMWRGGSDENS